MDSNYTWDRFVTRINVNAPIEKLYRLWSTRAGIEFWFLRMSEYKNVNGELRKDEEPVQRGDTYRWRWHGWSDDVTEEGTILDCNGKDQFKFSFGKAGTCTVNIINELGYTVVELIQENIPDDDQGKHYWHVGCKTGWTFYLANMKSLCEGGIDLRNRDEQLKNMLNA
jgi:uncharacterized protein YndB with AHSA1/START domain